MNAKTALLCLSCVTLACAACGSDTDPPAAKTNAPNRAAEHNARIQSIPESERAWPVYIEAFRSCPDLLLGEDSPIRRLTTLKPTDSDWPEAVRYVEDHGDTLRLLRDAAGRRVVGEPWSDARDPTLLQLAGKAPQPSNEDFWLLNVDVRDLSYFRDCCGYLALAARVHAKRGDADQAAADLEAIANMSRQIRNDPDVLLIPQLVAMATAGVAANQVCDTLYSNPTLFDDGSLEALSRNLGSLDFSLDWRYFTLLVDDTLCRAYADGGEGGVTRDGFWKFLQAASKPNASVPQPGSRKFKRMYATYSSRLGTGPQFKETADKWLAKLEEDAKTPFWNWRDVGYDRVLDKEYDADTGLWFTYLSVILPEFGRVCATGEGRRARRDAALVVIALHRYRLAHGRWPDALSDLVPAYLSEVPPDRYDGAPLRYRLSATGPIVYSVGVDRDDDGGVGPAPGTESRAHVSGFRPADAPDLPDGDWIFFPPSEN